jgi:hypothetical protein
MKTHAVVLAYLLAAAALPCHGVATSPASIATDKLVMGGPMIRSVMTANQSAAQQLPAEAGDEIGHRLHLNRFSSLSEVASPLAPGHSFVEQGIVLDHFLVFLVVFVVCIFR